MRFNHIYTYEASYVTYLVHFVPVLFCIGVSFFEPTYIIFAIFFILIIIYRGYYLKNKIVLAANAEGICVWRKCNSYLFCPWASIKSIQVKQYNAKHGLVDYLYIQYEKGAIVYASKATTYAQSPKEVDLEIISMAPSHKKEFSFYSMFGDIKELERTITIWQNTYALLDEREKVNRFLY